MIEPLENRIAPAAFVTFFESDGDEIKITSTKGTSEQLTAAMNGNTIQINHDPILDLTNFAEFAGANLTVKVFKKEKDGGNGRVDGIKILAYGGAGTNDLDLGKVTVKGNLTALSAGDDDVTTPAVKSIVATTWGVVESRDDATPSEFQGDIGTITVSDFSGYLTSIGSIESDRGTDIGKFTAKTVALNYGENAGHLHVRNIGKLAIKDTFYGPADEGYANNGLIEALDIHLLAIKRMTDRALIDLTGGAPAPV